MFEFSPEAKSALIEASWYEGRHIDTTPYREHWVKHGFFYGAAADVFLREFGDLEITRLCPVSAQEFSAAQERAEAMVIEPIEGVDRTWRENIAISSKQLGKPVTVIGYLDAVGGGMIFLMSEDQTVYADFSGDLYLVAPSGPKAIEVFVHGTKFTHIG